MLTQLRNIGNSRGLIIPKAIIEKYNFLDEVEVIETASGLIIKSANESTLLEKKVKDLKENKTKLYATLAKQSLAKETKAYYKCKKNNLEDLDLEIFD